MKTSIKPLYKPALIKLMSKYEQTIKQLKTEFLTNEVNDLETLEIWLEEAYCDMRLVHKEIIRRYSRPAEKIYPSKIGSEQKWSKELSFPFQSSSSEA